MRTSWTASPALATSWPLTTLEKMGIRTREREKGAEKTRGNQWIVLELIRQLEVVRPEK